MAAAWPRCRHWHRVCGQRWPVVGELSPDFSGLVSLCCDVTTLEMLVCEVTTLGSLVKPAHPS